jgi:hypothetical protein
MDIFGKGSDNFRFEKAAAGASLSFLARSSHMSTHTHIWHASLSTHSLQFRRMTYSDTATLNDELRVKQNQ